MKVECNLRVCDCYNVNRSDCWSCAHNKNSTESTIKPQLEKLEKLEKTHGGKREGAGRKKTWSAWLMRWQISREQVTNGITGSLRPMDRAKN